MLAEPLKPRVIELAADIFARLAAGATTSNEKGTSCSANPEALARLSFTLAAEFQKVEDAINADALPKNVGYKVQDSDIAGWMK